MAKLNETNCEVFVIHFNGKPLHLIKSRWNEWRPPKKIYHSERAAKIGMNYIPGMIKDQCEIVKYVPEKTKNQSK